MCDHSYLCNPCFINLLCTFLYMAYFMVVLFSASWEYRTQTSTASSPIYKLSFDTKNSSVPCLQLLQAFLEVPSTSKSLANIPPVLNPSNAVNLLRDIDRHKPSLYALVAPIQNLLLCHKRGGTIKGQKGHGDVVAFVDKTAVVNSTGNTFSCTVRGKSCKVLCEQTGCYPIRCNPCKSFRSTLRASLCHKRRSQRMIQIPQAAHHTSTCRALLRTRDLETCINKFNVLKLV